MNSQRIIRIFANSSLLLLILSGLTPAQPPPPRSVRNVEQRPAKPEAQEPEEVVRMAANLISVPVTVVNSKGQYVVDLQQDNFRIYEDGVEQAIAHFSSVDRAFSVVLLVDTSDSTAPFLEQIKSAAKAFLEKLRPHDKVQPVYFHGEIKSLTDTASSDRALLNAAIDRMEVGPIELGTRLYDAVDFALNTLSRESSRKAIILFTDGENTWGKATMKSTLREAAESDVIVYALQYGNEPPQKYLQQLADKTGGRYFQAGSINTIRQSFALVAEELRRQYLIDYYPNQPGQVGQERKIKVKVNRDRVSVRARKSYTYGS